jgi:hypothetical protein
LRSKPEANFFVYKKNKSLAPPPFFFFIQKKKAFPFSPRPEASGEGYFYYYKYKNKKGIARGEKIIFIIINIRIKRGAIPSCYAIPRLIFFIKKKLGGGKRLIFFG